MKKWFLVFAIIFCFCGVAFAQQEEPTESLKMSDVKVYAENDNFGLMCKNGIVVTKPIYKKLIRLGNGVWLVQKGSKFGLIDSNGKIVEKLKYRHAERMFGKYAKLGNDNDYGLHDEDGQIIIPHQYQSIDPLFGKMFLTRKNYRYGVVDINGKKLLNNEFEDIYMPTPTALRIKFHGEWFEIEKAKDKAIELPEDVEAVTINDKEFTVKHLIENTVPASGYSLVSTADYMLKLISSISPAYEETIDELMLSKGADTVSVFMKFSWLPKFPFTYAKKYYQNVKNPFNGPLSDIKSDLKRSLQD